MGRTRKRLRTERLLKGYTQQELADKAGVGRSRISELESGRHVPPPFSDQVYRIAAALGWPVADAYALLEDLEVGRDPSV